MTGQWTFSDVTDRERKKYPRGHLRDLVVNQHGYPGQRPNDHSVLGDHRHFAAIPAGARAQRQVFHTLRRSTTSPSRGQVKCSAGTRTRP